MWRCRLFRRLGAFPGSRVLGAREARVERPAETEEGPCLPARPHTVGVVEKRLPPLANGRGRRSPE